MKEEKESNIHIVLNKEITVKEGSVYVVFSVKNISCSFISEAAEENIKKEELIKEKSGEIFLCNVNIADKSRGKDVEKIMAIEEDNFKMYLANKVYNNFI